jgi:hypothetical protein
LEKVVVFFVAGEIATAVATKGLSDRPLETFGSHPCLLSFTVAWETVF